MLALSEFLEVRQKYSATGHIFNSLLDAWCLEVLLRLAYLPLKCLSRVMQ